MAKKKSITTSKRGRGRPATGLKMQGTDETFKRSYPGDDPKSVKFPTPPPNLEATLPDPKDEAAKHKFPPPRKHPVFRKVWMDFIDNIVKRENFKNGHLNALEILCDLHVEYEDLRTFLRENGRSYQSFGRAGMQWRFYPEVMQLNNVQSQIEKYMKVLGLILKKDHSPGNPEGEKNEWT